MGGPHQAHLWHLLCLGRRTGDSYCYIYHGKTCHESKPQTRCLRNHHDITFLYKTGTKFTYQFGGPSWPSTAHHHPLQLTCHHFLCEMPLATWSAPWATWSANYPLLCQSSSMSPSLPVASHKCQALASSWGIVSHAAKKTYNRKIHLTLYIVAFLKDSHFEQFFLYIIRLGWMRSNKQWIQGVFPSLNKFPWQNEVHCPSTELDGHLGKVPWHSSRWNPQFPKSLATLDVFPLDNTFWCICKCIIYIYTVYIFNYIFLGRVTVLTFNKKCSDFDDLTRNLKEIHFPVRSTANGPVNFHGKKMLSFPNRNMAT